MTQFIFLVAKENNWPQTVKDFYPKGSCSILFNYHYFPRNIDKFSIMITDSLNKIAKKHSQYKLDQIEVKGEATKLIKIETKTIDNKSTFENNSEISK